MYRNYDEYLAELEKMRRNAPNGMTFRKKTKDEFHRENYKDKVEWYLMEEWDTGYFHEIFFPEASETEESTPEEIDQEQRGYDLHNGVHNIIEKCYRKGMSVNQAAAKVYRYLKKKEAI